MQGAYDHIRNGSTMQLVDEGHGVTAIAASVYFLRCAPQGALGIPTKSERTVAELSASRLPFNLTETGVDLSYKVTANNLARRVDAHNIVAVNLEQAEQSSLRVFGFRLPESVAGRSIPNVTYWSFKHGFLNGTSGFTTDLKCDQKQVLVRFWQNIARTQLVSTIS